jgi:zinc protease
MVDAAAWRCCNCRSEGPFERAAVLCWPDGRRTLIGEDAISLTVEPTLFARAAAVPPAIDAAVPPDRRVLMPARDPSEIPQPDPERYRPVAAPPAGSRRKLWLDSGVPGFALLLFVFGGLTAVLVVSLLLDPAGVDNGDKATAMTGLVLSGFITRALVRRVEQVRRILG